MKINPLNCIDFYKADHRRQYPKGTTLVYSNFTARSDKLAQKSSFYDGKVVLFGLQYVVSSFLVDCWNDEFFRKPKHEVIATYKRRMDNALGKDSIPVDHIEALHDLGYLPICIKSLPEGSAVNIGVPLFVVYNTHPDFFWLTNYIETVISCMIWKPITSATTARQYRLILDHYAKKSGDESLVDFQAHDFSFRGMSGVEDAAISGAAHLLFFKGSDSVPSIDLLEQYYFADSDKELVACSVPATEHSVMCMGTKDDEIGTFRRLITELYPSGIVSIVSDTWDLWKVLNEYAPALKKEIEARDGKVVFRPDSGDPEEIIIKSLDILWHHFGGTINEKGFKVLNPKVGLIYGDAITLERAESILKRMTDLHYASTNIVFGVGSFSYQYCTRDSFGFAMKATYGEIDGEPREIFKDPITDSGVKKSAKGVVRVFKVGENFHFHDEQDFCEIESNCELETLFEDGLRHDFQSLLDIRNRKKK
jgi:nicotinamide phosphoribosyltransferase